MRNFLQKNLIKFEDTKDMIKGVIFDFNGTLFFDSPKHVLAWRRMSEELRGYGISEEEMQSYFYGVPNNRAIEYMLQKECGEAELDKYSELKEAYYREYCREDKEMLHLVAGAHELFDSLVEHKIPFTIASASIKQNIDFFVETFELKKWFDPGKIVYDDGSYVNKQSMFEHAAEIIGIPIEDCLIFEDSDSGIRDAYEIGCRNIIVVDSMGIAQKHEGKQGIIKIVKDLIGFEKEVIRYIE